MTTEPTTEPAPAPPPEKPATQPLDDALQELRDTAPHLGGLPGIKGSTGNGSAVWQIELDLQVVLGSTALSVADLLKLEAGSMIKLDQDLGQPLELAVNGRTVGYGELVDDAAGGLALHILRLHDMAAPFATPDAA